MQFGLSTSAGMVQQVLGLVRFSPEGAINNAREAMHDPPGREKFAQYVCERYPNPDGLEAKDLLDQRQAFGDRDF